MGYSIRDMAAALGVSKSQASRDKLDGMPMETVQGARAWRDAHRDLSRGVEGRLDAASSNNHPAADGGLATAAGAADRAAPASSDNETAEPAEPGDSAQYRQARASREQTNAERARIELDQLRGKLIDVDDARRLAFTAFRSLRDAVLNVPARVAAQAAAETDVLRVEQLLDAELVAALARFDPTRLLKDAADDEGDDESG